MSNVPLPATLYVLGIEGDGYTDDRCTNMPAWDDDAMHAHAAAVSAADNAALRAEVAGLREALAGLCIRSPGTIKYENALSVARTVLAARKGEA